MNLKQYKIVKKLLTNALDQLEVSGLEAGANLKDIQNLKDKLRTRFLKTQLSKKDLKEFEEFETSNFSKDSLELFSNLETKLQTTLEDYKKQLSEESDTFLKKASVSSKAGSEELEQKISLLQNLVSKELNKTKDELSLEVANKLTDLETAQKTQEENLEAVVDATLKLFPKEQNTN